MVFAVIVLQTVPMSSIKPTPRQKVLWSNTRSSINRGSSIIYRIRKLLAPHYKFSERSVSVFQQELKDRRTLTNIQLTCRSSLISSIQKIDEN